MRVVVTGGNGKAGQWVVRELAGAGHEVINFDLGRRPDLELPGEFCRVDLTDAGRVYDALAQFRPDGIAHLAANPAPQGQARIDVFDNNVISAHNLLQAAGDRAERPPTPRACAPTSTGSGSPATPPASSSAHTGR